MSATASKPKTSQPMELLADVARRATIESIRCRAIRAALLVDDAGAGMPLQASATTEVRFRLEGSAKLFVRVKGSMVGSFAFGEKKVDVVSAEAEFELTYAIAAGAELSHEALDAFAAVNGTFNAWPFLREAFFSETARLGIGPFLLGLRKVNTSGSTQDKADED